MDPPRTPSPNRGALGAGARSPDPAPARTEPLAPPAPSSQPEHGSSRPHSPALSAPLLASGSPSRPSPRALRTGSPTRRVVPRGGDDGAQAESTSQVGVQEAQDMLDQPENLLQSEERAVLEMLTSMSAPTPTLPQDFPLSAGSDPRPQSLPGILPSDSSPPPVSNPSSVVAPAPPVVGDSNDAEDEAEVTSLIAPTQLGGSTAVSYHSSDSSSLGQHSEESADPAFGRNLRALYRQQDPEQPYNADTAGLDGLGLPVERTVDLTGSAEDLTDGSDIGPFHGEEVGLPADFGYRAGFQTQPRMTFDVHTIEEVAEPSSSGTSATSRTELSVPPPRPPARIGSSPFGSVSVGSPLGSRFRTMLQQQREREQQGLTPPAGLLNAPRSTSPLRSPVANPTSFLTTQRSVSPLRSSSPMTFETPRETPNPTQAASPPPSSLSGSQPSSPSKVRQLSRFFESSASESSDSNLSASALGRRAVATAGVMGGAMAAAATRERERERQRDTERSLASSPTRRQPSGMTGSISNPTLGSRPDSPGARSPIFTASRSLGTFGPQATANTPPTTVQRPVARRGGPTRPSVRSIARQFASMIDDGSSSPRSGASSPRKPYDEDEKDQRTVEAILGDTTAAHDEDVPLMREAGALTRSKFGTIRSFTHISQEGTDREDSQQGAGGASPAIAVESPQRPNIRSGTLWYFNPHRVEPLWVEVNATLLVNALELRWAPSDIAMSDIATGLRLDLTECEDAHSVFSPDHGNSYLDIGAQTARNQGLMRINPFQLQFPDGIERLATRTPMERLHWIEAIRDVLRQNIPTTIGRSGATGESRETTMLNVGQTEPLYTPTRGSFVTADAPSGAEVTAPSSVRGPRAAAGNVTRLVSAFSETSSDRTPLTATLGQTAEPRSGPPVPPKRDGETSATVSPGDPQYGEVTVTDRRLLTEPSEQAAARSIGASVNDQNSMPEHPSTIRPSRFQSGPNFYDPSSTLSDQSRMYTAATLTETRQDEDLAFPVSGDIIDPFGPRTPPASSILSFHFQRSGSLLEPSDSASNRVVPSEIGTIRREPTQPPPFYAVSPEMADTSGEGRGMTPSNRGMSSTPGPSRFYTPMGSVREAQRASSHLPLSTSEQSLPAVPEEGPEPSRSASATPTQMTINRQALAEHDMNRSGSALTHRTGHSQKTATSVDSKDVAQLINYLEEQARARQARDRYLEEQIKSFQDTIAMLQVKKSDPSPPSEPSDSSGGQTMHTAPEDTPQPSEIEAKGPPDELAMMQEKLDRVLQIVSTFKGGSVEDDVAKILGSVTASTLSTATGTFQTASAGIPSPPHSLVDGDDSTTPFMTAPTTQGSTVGPPPSEPSSWISGSTLLSNWTGKSDRIPPRSWVSSMSQPHAPPNSEYAPSSLAGTPSVSDVTIKQSVAPSVAPSIPDSVPTIPSAPSVVTIDMEAEIRRRRAQRQQPGNHTGGWYQPTEKDLPSVPGIRWTPGVPPPMRAPSTRSASSVMSAPKRVEVATFTQEDFAPMPMPMPMPTPDLPSEPEVMMPPPEILMEDAPPPIIEDYPESARGSTVMSNASAEFREVLKKLQEAEEARQQQQKQQADIARYLNELNAWLERDVMDRTKEWKALSTGVQQLSEDLNNVRSRPVPVQLSDPPRSDDDRSSRPPRAESPTQPAALRPTTTLSLAPPIVAPQPYAGANWSNPEADRPESDSGQSRRSGRVWSAQDEEDEKDKEKKPGLLSRVASKTGKAAIAGLGLGAAALVGNEIRKHVEKRDDKEKREERDRENAQRKEEQEREKRQDKKEEQIRKEEAKEHKELIAALANEKKDKDKEKDKDKKDSSGVSEAAGAIAVTELAKLAADKAGGNSTTVVTPAGTVTTGKGAGGGGVVTTASDVPQNPKGVWQTNLPRAERVQAAFADPDSAPTPLKDTIKSALRPTTPAPLTTTANVADATNASKEAAKASKEAAVAAKDATTALNAAGGGTQKKKAAVEGDAAAPAKAAAPAVTVTPQPDGTVTVAATPAPAAKAAKGGAAPVAAGAAPGGAPVVIAAPAPAGGKAAAADAGSGDGKAKAGGDKGADKGGDKKDAKSIVKEVAGGAALTVAVEEILKHLLKQQDDARKQQDDAKKAEASLKAAQAESEKKAKEAREKEKTELVNAVVAKMKEEQAKEAKALDAKTAIEQLVANLNAQKAAEAKRQAEADAAIKKLADELIKINTEQNQKALAAVSNANKDVIQKTAKDHNEELTKLLSKEVKAMFEDVGKIRETKRALELEIGDLFAIKARHLKDVAPPKAAAPAEKKKGEEPKKKEEPKKEEPKKEEPKKAETKKPEPVKPPPLTAPLPDRLKYEPLNLNFGPRTAREGGAAPPAAAAAPKGDKPKEKDGKDGKEGKGK
ncbi:hypothetical protein OC842_000745 [Tilletia horrida]|uniref:PH domain-containing protein n=1 Tax=Tilletia horrida TaxID=155126 RepID=A0AAN6GGJ3_9BASI|nr:hypothetical protein OC842_000745 [Tilletia horrida]